MPTPDPNVSPEHTWNLSTTRVILALTAICVLRLILAVALYDPPRIWLHADDYCRALMSIYWAETPYCYPGDLHWLPLPFYVNGLVVTLTPQNAYWPFVLVSQTGMLLSILGVYALARTMFQPAVALVAAYLHAVTAWIAVMSYSALAEPIYYPLIVWGFAAYLTWWRHCGAGISACKARTIHLLAACICFTLAAAARYEAWLLIIIIGFVTLGRLIARRLPPGQVVAVIACLLVAGAVPIAWVAENIRVKGTLLAFYGANREDFLEALYHVPWFLRAFVYPAALFMLSPVIVLITGIALTRWRKWRQPGSGVLLAIVLGHLAVMIALYAKGSGPSFVERIVLMHLILLLPLTAQAIVRLWASRRGPVAVCALLLGIGIIETACAHQILAREWRSDYVKLNAHYEALIPILHEELADPETHVAVHVNDDALFLRFRTGVRDRLHAVTADNAAEKFAAHPIRTLYLPRTNAGHLVPDTRIERIWRNHHKDATILTHDRGFWRILKIQP